MSDEKRGSDGEKLLYCSFCGKSQHEVRKLIAGPSVFVCDECVELCNDIIRDEVGEQAGEERRKRLPPPQELCRHLDDYVIGQAASMGAVLLAAGAPGKRFALPNSRVMIHQPLGGFRGQASDIEIHAKEMLKIRDLLNDILSRHTGRTIDQIRPP